MFVLLLVCLHACFRMGMFLAYTAADKTTRTRSHAYADRHTDKPRMHAHAHAQT